MNDSREQVFAAPVFLLIAVGLFCVAIILKGLSLVGLDIPSIGIWPRLLLEWAVFLLILDIALLLRQNLENKL